MKRLTFFPSLVDCLFDILCLCAAATPASQPTQVTPEPTQAPPPTPVPPNPPAINCRLSCLRSNSLPQKR